MATLKNILLTIGQLILILFIGFLTRESWRIYSEGKKAERVNAAGTRILVRLDKVSNERRTWRDLISNSRYVTFQYEGKENTLRYSQDSVFLQEGISVPVIYSASTQEFIQPGTRMHQRELYKTSPLVRWTVLSLFSGLHLALIAFIGLAGLFVIFATGFLANLTGITLIRKFGDAVIFICAITGAIFLTYDVLAYWRYYSHVRHQGVPQTVKVEDIEKEREYQHNRDDDWWISYIYWARVNFNGESRIIAVGSKDFDHTKAGESLPILYDQGKDDVMSVNYTLEYGHFILPLFVWFIVLFIYNRRLKTWLATPRASSRPNA